jgi:hypothetical protein
MERDEIADVARYLNAVHYRFVAPSVTGSETGDYARGIAQASDPGQAAQPAPWLRGRRDAVPPKP